MFTGFLAVALILLAAGLMIINLTQVYDQELEPQGVRDGVDADNLSLLGTAWFILPLVLAVSGALSLLWDARGQRSEFQ